VEDGVGIYIPCGGKNVYDERWHVTVYPAYPIPCVSLAPQDRHRRHLRKHELFENVSRFGKFSHVPGGQTDGAWNVSLDFLHQTDGTGFIVSNRAIKNFHARGAILGAQIFEG